MVYYIEFAFSCVQDYYIRHVNGCTLDEAAEQHLKECLEAAINRRTSEVSLFTESTASMASRSFHIKSKQIWKLLHSRPISCLSASVCTH